MLKRILLLLVLLFVVACGSAETDTQMEEAAVEGQSADVMTDDDAMMDDSMSDDEAMMDDEAMSDDTMAENPDAMTEEDAMADEDAMMSDDDEMMSDDDAMHDDEMMSDDDEMMSDDDEMMSDDDEMMSDDGEMMSDDDEMMSDDDEMMSDDDEMMSDDEMMVDTSNLPAWQTISLINAHTGETFSLADFAGKTVFVEPMATWCTNCLRQLGDVQAAKSQLGDDVVFVGLSLETTLTSENLADYANRNGFDFVWAVLTPEMVRELAGEFGQTITNPPSTPHFIIRPNGTVSIFDTGFESTDELLEQIAAAQNS